MYYFLTNETSFRKSEGGILKINRIPKVHGSLTVEAALALPVFIYAIIAFIYFVQLIGLQECLQNAITETGYFAAKHAYVYEYLLNYESEAKASGQDESEENSIETSIETVIARSIDSAFYKIKVQDYLGVEKINNSCIEHGFSGIHTYLSSYMEEEDAVDIVLIYKIKIPLLFIELNHIQIVQRVRLRGWSGHKVAAKTSAIETPENNDTVFITESGTVYHLTKECTHLALSIKEAQFDQVEDLRNASGGKYKKCNLCGDNEVSPEGKSVYITKTGDRYHLILGCSGLKRTIIAIALSEVGNKSLCKRCGKQSE